MSKVEEFNGSVQSVLVIQPPRPAALVVAAHHAGQGVQQHVQVHRLTEDADEIEQEFVVEVSGEIAPDGLRRLNHGLQYGGRALAPCKVSWQNEVRLRFAIKGVQGGQLRDMCAQVGLDVVAIRRIRIGRIALAKMPVGTWRCLPVGERF